jgi:hypothetical protein
VELVSCCPSGVRNFEVVPRFVERFYTPCLSNSVHIFFFILILCIIDYVEINLPNALNYTLHYFSFTMAPTCFGKPMPSSGSDYVPFLATSVAVWLETSHRTYDGTYIPACYIAN